MWEFFADGTRWLAFVNALVLSTVVILAFSLLAYHFTYSFRVSVARRFSLLLACVMIVYASELAVTRITDPVVAERWLRFEWLGIAMLPAAYYLFSLAVLTSTNYRVGRRQWVAGLLVAISLLSAADALFGTRIVSDVESSALASWMLAGPWFWGFAAFFAVSVLLSLQNILKARSRCLTSNARRRMNFLLAGFIAPGVGVFPYLIALSRMPSTGAVNPWLFLLSIAGNIAVAAMLVLMSYAVAYFGVLTPDRVVRYRMVRFLMRGPLVAIFAILTLQVAPTLARMVGLPTDVVAFSLVTTVIVFSQLYLSVSKSLVDRLIYREDRDEVAWLREIDRHLLTTTDLRQFLENHLAVLCELLRVESGFVAAIVGSDLMLEATVGPPQARERVEAGDWSSSLARTLNQSASERFLRVPAPHSEAGYWLWPLQEAAVDGERVLTLGMIGVQARTEAPLLTEDEIQVVERMVERVSSALMDRRLQQSIFVTLQSLIPDIERIQSLRNVVPYMDADSTTSTSAALLDASPVDSPEFEAWVKDALSHYWGGPKLSESPLLGLRTVTSLMDRSDADPTKALRLVLGSALERLKPEGKQNFTAPEWLLYNILEMRFIQGRKVREIADRLAMSESDLYRKQRVAIGHLARVLSEMELSDELEADPQPNGSGGNSGESPVSQPPQHASTLASDPAVATAPNVQSTTRRQT
jgi:hypothetical protein